MSTPESLVADVVAPHVLGLSIAGVPLEIVTNDADVWTALGLYYAPWVAGVSAPAARVRLVQGGLDARGRFTDLVRRDGKRVKEAVQDLPGGRLVLKRATGVVMGLWPGQAFAVGDLRANLNQAINLVNACYAKLVLGRGHVLLHAAAVSRDGRAVVLAGPPGAGKSSAALHLVDAGLRFVSNDRVLARVNGGRVEALGYPKQPRVNPGTLLGHPRLSELLKPEERARLEAMDPAARWDLEAKRDVDLDRIYGSGTVDLTAEMRALVLLRWSRDGRGLQVDRLTPPSALERLEVFRKDLGAFDLDRVPGGLPTVAEMAGYQALVAAVPVFEVTGRVDFRALVGVTGALLAG
ncbi:MAG TPA: HprK-related kinase B [Methylomirabilota bacterium]|nr:HprK-related kinase B [Methylomirabilota bacterium]